MTQRSSATKPKGSRRSLPEISNGHRTSGFDSSTDSPQVVDQESEAKPQNGLPTFVVFLINFAIIYLGTVVLDKRFTLPCVTSQGSALGVVCLSLMVFHIIWRFGYPVMSEKKEEGTIKLPAIDIPLSVLIRILNSSHPWKLKRFGFVFFLIVLGSVMALNLTTFSPFRAQSQPFAIQGFSIQRSTPQSLEHLAPSETLTMQTGEKVILEVVLIGNAQVSCKWTTLREGNNAKEGCSIDYTALSSGENDILSVFVQPVCELRREAASLFITVQP